MRGAAVYWGRTHESSGMPAFWPWVQVGRAWGAPPMSRQSPASGALQIPELVRLFPSCAGTFRSTAGCAGAASPMIRRSSSSSTRTRSSCGGGCEPPAWELMVELWHLYWAARRFAERASPVRRERIEVAGGSGRTDRDTDLCAPPRERGEQPRGRFTSPRSRGGEDGRACPPARGIEHLHRVGPTRRGEPVRRTEVVNRRRRRLAPLQ